MAEQKDNSTLKVLDQSYDKESFSMGSCMQAYVCKNLYHVVSLRGESLEDVEERLGKQAIAELSHEAAKFCMGEE